MAERLAFRIDTKGTLEAVRAGMAEMPRGVERARKRALAKLMTWLKRQVLKVAAQAAGTSQKTLQALLRYRATNKQDGSIEIWIGANPLKVHHLGTVRWARRMTGARAGRQLFPGTWSWGKPSKTGPAIMERLTETRLPIQPVEVAIYEPIYQRLAAMQTEISERFERLMLQELNYALKVESQ